MTKQIALTGKGASKRERGVAMIPDISTNAGEDQSTGQSESPAEQSSIPPSAEMAQARQEASPQGRVAASVQRMPTAGRWALGLGLAFLSGFPMIVAPFVVGPSSFPIYLIFVLMAALALAAGFVLANWWAALALAAAAVAGGLAGSGMSALLTSAAAFAHGGSWEGATRVDVATAMFTFFAVLLLTPLILLMLAGVGIGRLQGMGLGQPHALSARERGVSRWIAALAPVVVFGVLAGSTGVLYTFTAQDAAIDLYSVGGVLVSSLSCLLAGWVLRSWRGLVAPSVVYVVIAATNVSIGWVMTRPSHDFPAMVAGFALLVIAPAVVMSAIGTVIGMRASQRSGPLPQRPQSPLPAT